MRRSHLVVTLMLCCLVDEGRAEDRPVVAVFDIEDRGGNLDAAMLSNLTDFLAAKLAEGGFLVVPRDQIRERLREQAQDSYKSCYDQGCQIELGREMAAQKSLSTQVLRLGDVCQVTAVIFDLKKSAGEGAAVAQGECDQQGLSRAIAEVTKKLAETSGMKSVAALRGLLPGTLIINAEPAGSIVTIDGEDVGQSPMTFQTSPGEHTVAIRAAGYGRAEQKVTLEAGKISKVALAPHKLASGVLDVRAEPGETMVTIDGKDQKRVPFRRELAAGQYVLVASAGGFRELEQKVSLDWEKTTHVQLTLESFPHYTRWGHVAFWSGVALGGLAGLFNAFSVSEGSQLREGDMAAGERSRLFMGMTYTFGATGIAFMLTGIVLWGMQPSDDELGKQVLPAIGPASTGTTLGVSGRF